MVRKCAHAVFICGQPPEARELTKTHQGGCTCPQRRPAISQSWRHPWGRLRHRATTGDLYALPLHPAAVRLPTTGVRSGPDEKKARGLRRNWHLATTKPEWRLGYQFNIILRGRDAHALR